MARAKKCKHAVYWWMSLDGGTEVKCPEHEAKYRRCCAYHSMLPLGPSNDDSEQVRVEMRAAELEADMDDAGEYDENQGWWSHPDERGIDWNNDPPYAQEHFAGYLARELATHDDRDQRDADAWPWDPSRPVVGQYEELQVAVKEFTARADDLADTPLTVSLDSDTVKIGNLYVSASFTPDEAEALADALLIGADAARQAAQDGYHGPAVVLGLEIGEEPEQGVEFEPTLAHEADADCHAIGCLKDGSAYEPDDEATEDAGLIAIAESVDPNDPTHIETDGPLPSPECMNAIIAQNPPGEPLDGPPDRLAACSGCEVPFGCRDGHCLRGKENEREPMDDFDLQAGGPALATAEAYELWRASEPDCRDEDDPVTLALLAAAGADLTAAELLDIGAAVERGQVELAGGETQRRG